MKKWFLMSLATVTVGTTILTGIYSVHADEKDKHIVQTTKIDDTKAVEEEKLQLTLSDALEKALTNNLSIQKAKLDLENAKIGKDLASSIADGLELAETAPDFAYTWDTLLSKYVTKKQAELGYDVTMSASEYTKLQITFEVKKAYYDVLQAIEQLENMEIGLIRAVENKKNTEIKLKQGLVTKKDLLDADIELKKMELAVFKSKEDIKKAKWKLNQLLNEPIKTELVLLDSFPEQQLELKDDTMENWLAIAEKNRPDFQQKQMASDIANIRFNTAKSYFTPNVNTYKQIKIEKDKADLDLLEAKQDLEYSILEALSDLETSAMNMEQMELNLESAKESYRIIELQAELGLVTPENKLGVQSLLNNAEISYTASKYQVLLSKLRLELTTGMKLLDK